MDEGQEKLLSASRKSLRALVDDGAKESVKTYATNSRLQSLKRYWSYVLNLLIFKTEKGAMKAYFREIKLR